MADPEEPSIMSRKAVAAAAAASVTAANIAVAVASAVVAVAVAVFVGPALARLLAGVGGSPLALPREPCLAAEMNVQQ